MRVLLFAVLTLFAEPALAGECLAYEKPVTLTGIVVEGDFPGVPNYESVARGDQLERTKFLVLGTPICTAGSELGDPLDYVNLVQIVCYSPTALKTGEAIDLPGTLTPATTAHYHAPVALFCDPKLCNDLCRCKN